MTANVQALFQPFELGSLRLPTRVVMAPMTRSFSPNGVPTDAVVDYYRRRAAAGVGLIITEGTTVGHAAANGYPQVPRFYGEDALAGWKRVVDAVHAAGGRIVPQLWHVGNVRRLGTEPDASVPGYGPMEKCKDGNVVVHGMTQQDIRDVIGAFAQAARDAKAIGMDGVEIHGAHGYLIDQFFWEGSNQRTDEYGGSLANRSRFAVELVQAVREAVGPDFPIIFRFSQWKQQDYTARLVQSPEALGEFLAPLVEAGVDIFHCSTRRFWEPEFEGSDLNLAGWTRQLTGKPTITVGSVGLDGEFLQFMVKTDKVAQPAGIEGLLERLNKAEFDLVAVGRALICDPEWAVKVREGRMEEILPFSREALKTLA
ncbi:MULTISPECIES: NADH:flavin oxidoreductase [Stutzerimonas]|jgi:2,4-dienoyl-CoA reductase-like NADH-dependent reductase (Old Yellow Enzyme family)|uniref:1,2-oxophytodienoate reductase n=2 Tax=Stutzerimonas balearica TaxID=74829 RepID=A0A8D4C2Q1_9GAMM|nr:NADH:flavin oxidoreductase [Stutzerimonas balearica]AJE16417.1 1,2-oxophytodienoate reductase [Stutzerimonas balearica DSM 6083]MBC7197973.1 NADH:flavin oxidoreductase [Stutzerimonas balearica]MBD3735647.1 NADH:flavin oxidoreductase [Stutzerimonas balearica]MBK3749402.1 12-oxophytodienoate reductase [Stutzerimonas balearica]MBK3827597.1 12-oxophytodienoate reductase [Stutzerimonas balearica]